MIILYANNLLNPYPYYPGSISPDDVSSYKTDATRHPTPPHTEWPASTPPCLLTHAASLSSAIPEKEVHFVQVHPLCLALYAMLSLSYFTPPLHIQLLLSYWLISPLSINTPQFLPILAWIFMHPPQADVFSPISFASACLVNHHCTLNPHQ